MARNTTLITGASTGIGAIYAERLAQRGHDLILVARNGDRLEATAENLRAATGRTIETVTADLGQTDDLARVENLLRERDDITALVNNAGVGAVAPLHSSDVDAMATMTSTSSH
jgi:short-subunit dehydrogenase